MNEKLNVPIVSAGELRDQFLACAPSVINKVVTAYVDNAPKYTLIDAQERLAKMIWPTVQELILQVGDAKRLEATTTADVLVLLKTGKVTVDEACKLMTMFRTQSEAEVLPNLHARLDEMEANRPKR